MRSGKTTAALALLLALLTGCGPKQPQPIAPPQVAQAPSLPPSQMVALLSRMPPPMPVTNRPLIKLDTTAPPETKIETANSEPRKPPKHHAKSTSAQEAAEAARASQTPAASTQAQNVQPSEMSPIGQLSTANDNSNTADRQKISSDIDSTENGLNAIKRSFSSDEQKTVALIRTYITRARDALKADDLEGARNMSSKAHQLLQELTKP